MGDMSEKCRHDDYAAYCSLCRADLERDLAAAKAENERLKMRLSEFHQVLGEHPDTDHECVVGLISGLRHEARQSADLALRLAECEKDARIYRFLRDGPKSPHIIFSVSAAALREFGGVDEALLNAIEYYAPIPASTSSATGQASPSVAPADSESGSAAGPAREAETPLTDAEARPHVGPGEWIDLVTAEFAERLERAHSLAMETLEECKKESDGPLRRILFERIAEINRVKDGKG
jgi:hypothetical protein